MRSVITIFANSNVVNNGSRPAGPTKYGVCVVIIKHIKLCEVDISDAQFVTATSMRYRIRSCKARGCHLLTGSLSSGQRLRLDLSQAVTLPNQFEKRINPYVGHQNLSARSNESYITTRHGGRGIDSTRCYGGVHHRYQRRHRDSVRSQRTRPVHWWNRQRLPQRRAAGDLLIAGKQVMMPISWPQCRHDPHQCNLHSSPNCTTYGEFTT